MELTHIGDKGQGTNRSREALTFAFLSTFVCMVRTCMFVGTVIPTSISNLVIVFFLINMT